MNLTWLLPVKSRVRIGGLQMPWLLAVLLVAGAYFGAARLGLLLASIHGNVSPVWPATGLAIGTLLLGGIRLWPGVALGAFVANALTPIPPSCAAVIGVGNTLEAVVGALIILKGPKRFPRWGLLATPAWMAIASLVAPVVSATFGVTSLVATGTLPVAAVRSVWETWWVGDALGALMFTPALLALRNPPGWSLMAVGQAVGLGLATAAIGWLVFYIPNGVGFLFAVFPLLLLAVAWFGAIGVTWTAILITGIAVTAAHSGSGPFTSGTLNQNLVHLQLFLTSVAAAALVLPVFRAVGKLALPGGVLLLGWVLSGTLFYYLQHERLNADHKQLEQLAADAQKRIAGRMDVYIDALRSGAALFATSNTVTRAQWRLYAESLRIYKRYPGINGIGVVFRVSETNVADFLTVVRQDGMPDFTIHAVPLSGNAVRGPRSQFPNGPEHFVITYLEPLTNYTEVLNIRPALGLDLASETNRFMTAMFSAAIARPCITGRIQLVQDSQQRDGFLLYQPIYRFGMPTQRVHERRAAVLGWVYAPFITELFVAGALPEANPLAPAPNNSTRPERPQPEGAAQEVSSHLVQLHFFDGKSTNHQDLLYTTPDEPERVRFEQVTELVMGMRIFTLGWNRGSAFQGASLKGPLWAAVCSAFVSLLLAGLVMSLQTLGRRANTIAAEQTRELAQAHAALESLSALNRAIVNQAAYSVISTTTEGIITSFNPAAERLLGYRADEVVGQVTPAVIHDLPEVAARAKLFSEELGITIAPGFEVFVAKTRLNLPNQYEWIYVRKDGSRFPVVLGVTALRNDAGDITGFVGVASDITELKHTEAALRASEAQNRLILENVQDYAIYLLDAEGRIASWNPGAERIKGYAAAAIIGQHFSRFLTEADRDRGHQEEILRIAQTSGRFEEEGWRVRKDGARFWASVIVTAIRGPQGELLGYAKVTRDITAHKQIEEALRASLAEKEILLKEIHHRVKNNMQVISSILQLQSNQIDDERYRAMFGDCQNRVRSMAMIHEKLYRTKNLATIDFGEHVRELATMLVRSYGRNSSGVELVIRAESHTLDVDTAIPAGLILNELISNSLKYAFQEHRGRLSVTFVAAGEQQLLLEVSDDGAGLPVDFALDKAPSLGLKMVHSLARQIRGNLTVGPGPGTSFSIIFPRTPVAEKTES